MDRKDYENQIAQLRQIIENNKIELARLSDQILLKKLENENLIKQVGTIIHLVLWFNC